MTRLSVGENFYLDNHQILVDDSVNENNNGSEIPIPNELLTDIIFKYVPPRLWSSCLEFVSPQFRRCVILAYGMLKTLNIRLLLPYKLCGHSIEANCPIQLQNGYLFCSRPKSDRWLTAILVKLLTVCPNLTDLTHFHYVSRNFGGDHFDRLKQFRKLQSLSFMYLDVDTQAMTKFCTESETLKTLKLFRLKNHNCVGESMAKKIMNICLTCRECTLCFEKFYENLTTLEVDNPKVLFKWQKSGKAPHLYDAIVMENCRNLKSLTAYLWDQEDGELILKVLDNLYQLTDLRLEVKGTLPGSFESNLCVSLDLKKDRLQSFHFYYCTYKSNATNAMLQDFLFAKCINLINLELFPLLDLDSVNELHQLSGSLEKLTITFYPLLIPILLPNLMKLSNLTTLHLYYTPRSSDSDKTWENLCYLEKLRHLWLPGDCVSDDLLKFWDSHGNKMFERLDTLELPRCKRVSDSGFCLFAKKAINLEKLDLRYSAIGDSSICILAETAKKLTFAIFNQQDPLLIGEDALILLIKKCFRLKKLAVNETLINKLYKNSDFLPFQYDITYC